MTVRLPMGTLMIDVALVDTLSWLSWEDYNVRSLMRHFFPHLSYHPTWFHCHCLPSLWRTYISGAL